MAMPEETKAKIKEDLRKAEALLKEIEPEAEKAKMAGLPVQDQLDKIRKLKADIEKMKLVYGI
jgi:hypothetical protein